MRKVNSVIILLILSLVGNLYFIYQWQEAKTNLEVNLEPNQSDSQVSSVTKSIKPNYTKLNLEDNPIDNLFKEIDCVSDTTINMRKYTNLYRQLWENEMNHAYEKLMERGHAGIKQTIFESKDTYVQYARNEAEVLAAVYASSAFDSEYKDDDSIHYGTISLVSRNNYLASLYKKRTIYILNYMDSIGMKIEFIFNKNNLSDSDLEILESIILTQS